MISNESEITECPVRSSEPDHTEKPVKPEITRNPISSNNQVYTYEPLPTDVPVQTDIYDETFRTNVPTRQPVIGPTKAPVTPDLRYIPLNPL